MGPVSGVVSALYTLGTMPSRPRTSFLVAAVLLAILPEIALATKAGKDDFLIIPAQRIGLLRLGMAAHEAKRFIHEAHGVLPFEDIRPRVTVLEWPGLKLHASFLDGKAISLTTKDSRWRLRNGIRIGSTLRETTRKLGRPLDYERQGGIALGAWKGLEVEFHSGKIALIAVCCD